MNYIIVKANSTRELEGKVRVKLLEGYKPTGGVTINRLDYYMQAMWKEE